MTSKKQVKANRKNAQKSTGPKTDEGKAAVSKNAVKHGLFAEEAVVTGENPADYEAYLDNFLTEMKPVGAVENMLAERFVSLAWRLMRAQRMQNQAIENFIEKEVTNPLPRRTRVLTCHVQGIPLGDKRCLSSHLPLGRIATSDWSCTRVLERTFMYERRIELSMTRILREFKKQQIMRRVEQQDIGYDQAANETEALTGKHINLKKQSQFSPGMMGASPFMTGGYDDFMPAGNAENKANPPGISKPTSNRRTSQGQFDAPFSPEVLRKIEKPPTAATG